MKLILLLVFGVVFTKVAVATAPDSLRVTQAYTMKRSHPSAFAPKLTAKLLHTFFMHDADLNHPVLVTQIETRVQYDPRHPPPTMLGAKVDSTKGALKLVDPNTGKSGVTPPGCLSDSVHWAKHTSKYACRQIWSFRDEAPDHTGHGEDEVIFVTAEGDGPLWVAHIMLDASRQQKYWFGDVLRANAVLEGGDKISDFNSTLVVLHTDKRVHSQVAAFTIRKPTMHIERVEACYPHWKDGKLVGTDHGATHAEYRVLDRCPDGVAADVLYDPEKRIKRVTVDGNSVKVPGSEVSYLGPGVWKHTKLYPPMTLRIHYSVDVGERPVRSGIRNSMGHEIKSVLTHSAHSSATPVHMETVQLWAICGPKKIEGCYSGAPMTYHNYTGFPPHYGYDYGYGQRWYCDHYGCWRWRDNWGYGAGFLAVIILACFILACVFWVPDKDTKYHRIPQKQHHHHHYQHQQQAYYTPQGTPLLG